MAAAAAGLKAENSTVRFVSGQTQASGKVDETATAISKVFFEPYVVCLGPSEDKKIWINGYRCFTAFDADRSEVEQIEAIFHRHVADVQIQKLHVSLPEVCVVNKIKGVVCTVFRFETHDQEIKAERLPKYAPKYAVKHALEATHTTTSPNDVSKVFTIRTLSATDESVLAINQRIFSTSYFIPFMLGQVEAAEIEASFEALLEFKVLDYLHVSLPEICTINKMRGVAFKLFHFKTLTLEKAL